ncbi:MAG TPA: PQQ-dependent sugar dehydrogenase [Gemmatimonadaceae bacterium]|jgi:glucose/arabinose dehydrogenase|nr:PQQ-dependent sugar dehydrogenase [Gemmatimonadaceae bacterium]
MTLRRFVALLFAVLLPVHAQRAGGCDNAGLMLPSGFCATIFADSLPGVRSIAVAPNGDLFVARDRSGAGVTALRERDGHLTRDRFAGGFNSSQVALFDGHLYTESSPIIARGQNASGMRVAIIRYRLAPGGLTPSSGPDTIVHSIPFQPGHSTRNFAITKDGVLYLNIGSPTNSCQAQDRKPGEPGINPCTELETRAGIWRFDARKTNQTPSASNHFARGIRNAVGIAIAPDGKLWGTQHGRDQLGDWSKQLGLTDSAAILKYNAENPAEELLQVNEGEDYGWPYCYYAVEEHHLVLAPEYGGNGKTAGQCAQKKEPVAVQPGHWAPNALMFYTGSMFPARYRNGAFIAFHGSWNRAPEKQGGFNVVFQPLNGGKSGGTYEVFADNFSPTVATGSRTGTHRPTGLAESPDGALYVADDTGGRIYKITYEK